MMLFIFHKQISGDNTKVRFRKTSQPLTGYQSMIPDIATGPNWSCEVAFFACIFMHKTKEKATVANFL